METAFYWSALGYRVISWDQRGGGDNRDSHITFGYSEADDLNNLYTAITNNKKELTGTFNKIDDAIIYGQSNGAATVISFADRFQTQIKNSGINTKFIEESGYTSPKRQFQTALNLHGIMPAAVVPLTIPMYELYAERNLSDADADYLAQSDKIKQPLFIVHGDEDPIVDFQMGVDLYKKMEANKGTKPENNAEPSIYIGKGLKHIGVSRASKINTTSAELNGVKKLLSELTKTADKARADALWTAFKANKNVVGYPDAVRFFYHMYMWDRFGTPFKELGGHDA